MSATHVMTPARRAALRKAQLASAAKRRKYGTGYNLRKGISQSYQAGKANALVVRHNKQKRRQVLKRTAVGVTTAAVLGSAVYGGAKYHASDRAYINRGLRKSVRKVKKTQLKRAYGYGKPYKKEVIAAHKIRVRPLIAHNAKRRKKRR